MQKIKILDPQEAIKIAAGEVVERPAHILKELLENSIDAGATEIIIHSQQAGKKLLSITDNGCGMSEQDAQLCFAHHATSKISQVCDLDTITTYGFRGEALSSIVSVAQVTITTKTDEEKSATQLILEHGKLKEQHHVAHSTGTTIKVENLFDNIPARKKFLKSNDTEWNSIISIFQAFCLRYPKIHFKLFHDDKLSYNCPATTSLIQRCAQLWSNNLHDQLLEIASLSNNDLSVSGAISKSHYHRYNRNQIFTFVNNRWVKNIELSRAIIKGYQNVLPPQKYPAAFLFVDIDPKLIDVNIHPKKEEVKFLHPGTVQKIVQEAVTKTLNASVTQTLEEKNVFIQPHQQALSSLFEKEKQPKFPISVGNDKKDDENCKNKFSLTTQAYKHNHLNSSRQITASSSSPTSIGDSAPYNLIENSNTAQQLTNNHIKGSNQDITTISLNNDTPINSQQFVPSDNKVFVSNNKQTVNQTILEQEPFSIIGQFNTTYIMIEKSDQLILIDQHAAHERILYENFKKNFSQVASVQLLFPHIIKLSQTDISLIIEHTKLFSQHGIKFEQFSDTELIIQATPVSLQHKAINDIVHTTLNWIKQHEHVPEQDFFKQLNEQLHAQKACKTAVKAGDTLNQEQMLNIVKTLLDIENNFCCPHGRPTMWNMTLKDIEKHFKRDYKSNSRNDFM